ncbi:MAG TPA: carboxypeptidase regulatory-like domain-containing protein [Bryobacteraceae bacterium]|nr:carboxypeptidase regulatory-like domain-containing protein [Bryobacteraceae bacterium]
MNDLRPLRSMGLLVVLAATLLTARCGTTRPPEKPAPGPAAAAKAVEYFHVDPSTAGSLRGKIVYRGAKPAKAAISMEAEAGCQQAHAGHPVYEQPVAVSKDGGLANAFVYIQAGLEGKNFEPVKEAVMLDQHGCLFAPRVIGIRAGQTLDVNNSDTVSHNVHPMPKENREFNEQQSPGSPDVQHRFPRPEIMIPVKCNVHSWMHAYIGVMPHPFFAVTGADGSFEFTNVPPGDYTIAVWHEKLGNQAKQVHLGASARAGVDFTFR